MMTGTSYIEISRSALLHNADFFKRRSAVDKLYAVVKGNAYGHGQALVVSVLNTAKAIYGYQVYELLEALSLSKMTSKPIAVLGYVPDDPSALRRASQANITIPLYNERCLRLVSRLRRPLSLQIKVDIGTHRLGFLPGEVIPLIKRLQRSRYLTVTGIFSHYADSENSDSSLTVKQSQRFDRLLQEMERTGLKLPLNHIACTAALAKQVKPQTTAARLGLGLYGLSPIAGSLAQRLRPVLSWKSEIIHLQRVTKGEYIGYARRYQAKKAMRIATIPVGYYDGYSRALSNRGYVLIGGRKRVITGAVCMNMMMVEATADCHLSQPVVLIGRQEKQMIKVEDIAARAGTINYEMVTRLNPAIHRILRA